MTDNKKQVYETKTKTLLGITLLLSIVVYFKQQSFISEFILPLSRYLSLANAF